MATERPAQDEEYLTLLFYNYVPVPEPGLLTKQQQELCTKLGLTGRLRVATEGINGCLGGTPTAIETYVRTAETEPAFAPYFQHVDWKRGECRSDRPVAEQKMEELIVKVVPEVVSFGSGNTIPDGVAGGKHVTPAEFHSMLAQSKGEVALIDVRNRYESAIGHFSAKEVVRIDPLTRQFTDFADSISRPESLGALKGKKVLMYCTGGVRCERASAFLRGKGIEDVYQLQGGIHRYLEAYPDGGFWKGKNFVFDKRLAVGAPKNKTKEIIGKCLLCASPCDDYGPAFRCVHCRLLVLVCNECQTGEGCLHIDRLCCEACAEERSVIEKVRKDGLPDIPRYLHVLCLHDVNSNGRLLMHFLRRAEAKCKKLVRFHVLDAPFACSSAIAMMQTPVSKKQRVERRTWANNSATGAVGDLQCAKNHIQQFLVRKQKALDEFHKNQDSIEDLSSVSTDVLLSLTASFDGVLGVGQGAEIVEAILRDAQDKTFRFGCALRFYDPAFGETKEAKCVPISDTDKRLLTLPIPANSSFLKDTKALGSLRTFLSDQLFGEVKQKVAIIAHDDAK